MANHYLAKAIIPSSLLLLCGVASPAQKPLSDLVSQVNRAVVIVHAEDDQGNSLSRGSGFFIAPNRIITNLHIVESLRVIQLKTNSGQTVLVRSIVTKYPDMDLAILETEGSIPGVTPLHVARISRAGLGIEMKSNRGPLWNVTTDRDSWEFEHLRTHLRITASLSKENDAITLRGHATGSALVENQTRH